jgi:hypothetical protein
MERAHDIQATWTDLFHFYITADGQTYRIQWGNCSPRLARASQAQRQHLEVSPSGYGIHWPEIDEDLAVTPLLRCAEVLALEMAC